MERYPINYQRVSTILKHYSRRLHVAFLLAATFVFVETHTVEGRGIAEGTPIGNAATANYRDGNNNNFTTTSPIVTIVVAEVCGLDIDNGPINRESIDGQTIDIPLSIQNTGNGANTFDFTVGATTFTTNIFEDKDGDGEASFAEVGDGTIDSISVEANATGRIVIQVTADAAAVAPANFETFNFVVAGTLPGGCDDTVDITTTIINDALVSANKVVDRASANSGESLSYTVNFQNTGTLTALSTTPINIDSVDRDGIFVIDPIPTGTQYVTTSGNGQPSSGLNGAPSPFIVFSTDNAATWISAEPAVNSITHIGFFMPDLNSTDGISQEVLAANQSGFLNFNVTVNDPFDDPDLVVDNMASILWRPADGLPENEKITETNATGTVIPVSNSAGIAIGGLEGFSFTGEQWITSISIPSAEEDAGNNFENDNYATNIPAGQSFDFRHRARNDSVVGDVVNLETVTLSTLPFGSFVTFLESTGSTILIDSNFDGKIDIGTIPGGGGTKDFVVRVTIPANAGQILPTGDGDNPTFFVDIMASSVNDPTETDLSRNNVDGIIGAGVDIGAPNTIADGVNDPSDGNTDGTADSDDVTNNPTVAPGDTIEFPLHIANTGGSPDSFSLSATNLPTGAVPTFFTDPNCDGDRSDGVATLNLPLVGATATLSDSSDEVLNVYSVSSFSIGDQVIIAGEQREVTLIDNSLNTITVTPPLGAAPGLGVQVAELACIVLSIATDINAPAVDGNIVVSVTGASGSSDDVDVDIQITSDCDVTISTPNSRQLPQGGTTTYSHSLVNNGNSTGFARIDLVATSPVLSYLFIARGTVWQRIGANEDAEVGDTAMIDGEDAPLNTIFVQLGPSATADFQIQVQASTSDPIGTFESVDIRVVMDFDGDYDGTTDDQCSAVVSDQAQVINGFLDLSKTAATEDSGTFNTLDGTCTDGTPDLVVGGPCDKITYTITYQNVGTQDAINVVVTDQIPDKTTFVTDSASFDVNCDDGGLKQNAADTVTFDAPSNIITWTLADPVQPGQSGCLIFETTINGE